MSCLEFLETLLHSSFILLARSSQLRPRLVNMVMGALNDAQIEVRDRAAQVITEELILTESGQEGLLLIPRCMEGGSNASSCSLPPTLPQGLVQHPHGAVLGLSP